MFYEDDLVEDRNLEAEEEEPLPEEGEEMSGGDAEEEDPYQEN